MTGLRQIIAGLCFCTQLFCMAGDALAETVSDLYVAEVPVAGQTDAARSAAVREAFAKVLVKVSGDRDLPLRGKLRDLLSRVNSYVQQYGYRMPETAQGTSAEAAAGNAAPDRLLRVRFEEQAVNRELRQSGVPVWRMAGSMFPKMMSSGKRLAAVSRSTSCPKLRIPGSPRGISAQ